MRPWAGTSYNTQYATTFCSVSLRKTPSIFARGKLPLVANYTTGKHRILRNVVRHALRIRKDIRFCHHENCW